jgi:hypothetical protein
VADLATYLQEAGASTLRSMVEGENEAILGWCKAANCTPQELAERFDIRSEMSTEPTESGLRFVTKLWLEPKLP